MGDVCPVCDFDRLRREILDALHPGWGLRRLVMGERKEATMLFEVAVLMKRKQKSDGRVDEEELIYGPVAVVANDEAAASVIALADVFRLKDKPDAPVIEPDRVQVLARRFV